MLDWCAHLGLPFLPWFPLAGGDRLLHGERALEQALRRVADRHQTSAARVALAWLLSRDPVVVAIPGTSRLEHARDNVAATALHLSQDDLTELDHADPDHADPDRPKHDPL